MLQKKLCEPRRLHLEPGKQARRQRLFFVHTIGRRRLLQQVQLSIETFHEPEAPEAFVVGLQENGVKLHLPTYCMDEFAFVCDSSQANPFSLEEEGRVLRGLST